MLIQTMLILVPLHLLHTGEISAPLRVEVGEITAALRGQTIVVEGVYASQLTRDRRKHVRLKFCDAKFIFDDPTVRDLEGNLEIVGTVRVERGEVFVDVENFDRLPDDVRRFNLRLLKLDDTNPDGWFELASWGRDRAKRYPNPTLELKALEAYESGIRALRRRARGKPEALAAIIARIASDKVLTQFDLAELKHEMLQGEYRQLAGTANFKTMRRFCERIRQELQLPQPANITPLTSDWKKKYEVGPELTFREADRPTRFGLARFWQQEILGGALTKAVADGDLTTADAAKLAAELLPDSPGVEKRWIEQTLEQVREHLVRLSPSQIADLAEMVERRLGDRGLARDLRLNWLRLREQEWLARESQALAEANRLQARPPARNALARFELAQTYRSWFPDQGGTPHPEAVRLTEEAVRIDPEFSDAAAQLRQFGWDQGADGRWSPPQALGSRAEDKARRLRTGARAAEVIELLGTPSTQNKIATSQSVLHVWLYDTGRLKTTVVLRQDGPSTEPRLLHINGVSPEQPSRAAKE